jgi:PEP-CTERM motif-containing protein
MFLARHKFLFILALLPAQSFASTLLYGVTLDDNVIQILITPSTVSATLIGTLDTVTDPFGGSSSLGIGQTGSSLYVYDQNQQALLKIDPTTAATVSTTNLGILNTGEGDFAFAPSGTGYLVSTVAPDGSFDGTNGSMYSFTTAANSSAVVSTTVPLLDGLTFDASGNGYALAQGGGILYSVSTAGVVNQIGVTGITNGCDGSACSLGGLTFGGTTLYAALSNFSNSTSTFYTIDPTTGVATLIGDINFDQVSGISGIAGSAPEPSTWVLMAGGALAIVLRRLWTNNAHG